MRHKDNPESPSADEERNRTELQAGDAAARRATLEKIFADIEEIRKHVDRSKFSTVKALIEEGRK